MKTPTSAILAILLTLNVAVADLAAADNPAAQLMPKRFTAEPTAVSVPAYRAARPFTQDAPKAPQMSKRTKIAVIIAVAGAAVAGIFLAKGALTGGSSKGGGTVPPPGQTGSIVVINGVRQ